MLKFIESASFLLLVWSPILLLVTLYASIRSLKSAGCTLISFWTSLIISTCMAFIITLAHKLSVGWAFSLLEYFLALCLFLKWILIIFLIVWPFITFANTKSIALKSQLLAYVIFGVTGLSIEIANYTYVISSKKQTAHSWDNFFDNNEVGKPPQISYLKLSEPEIETIRWHLNPGNDLTTEQLKVLSNIFKGSDNSILHSIAENPNVDREIIEEMLKTPYREGVTYYIGQRIARNRNTPPDILARLIGLPDEIIIAAVARNKNTPRNILKNMGHPDAKKTLLALNQDDNARDLIKLILDEIQNNKLNQAEANFRLAQNLYIDSPSSLIEMGKISVILFGSSTSNKYYELAENRLHDFGGRYRLDYCRENIMILLLLGKEKEALQLLSKLHNWYPDNKRVRTLIEDFPVLKDELVSYVIKKRE